MMICVSKCSVVEQDCSYQDADEKDKDSHHLMGYIKGVLVAYLRLVKPGISYEEMSFGRIVIAQSHRGAGLGVALMKEGIAIYYTLWTSKSYFCSIAFITILSKNLALNLLEKNT